jgi:hypothetical protein
VDGVNGEIIATEQGCISRTITLVISQWYRLARVSYRHVRPCQTSRVSISELYQQNTTSTSQTSDSCEYSSISLSHSPNKLYYCTNSLSFQDTSVISHHVNSSLSARLSSSSYGCREWSCHPQEASFRCTSKVRQQWGLEVRDCKSNPTRRGDSSTKHKSSQ